MPLKTSQLEEMPALNLTSLIDVLFLLIIFFMVGTKFIENERQIELEVPKVAAGGALSAAPEKRVVNVYHDGVITLDGQTVTLAELTARLAHATAQYKRLGVLVRGDGNAPLQQVANVLAACKQAGVGEMAIAVRAAAAEPAHARR
ncbi:MAG TPA: biopolymer transporter ExbD [Pirellulales bacterium]|nr:biopolymer transporter ExbD [Pirellulales bacterium]